MAVVAPAGYGKTTLLAQWAARLGPRVAWVSLDDRDNDPAVLLTYLAVALDRVERIDPTVLRSLGSRGGGIADVGRLVGSLTSWETPIVVVLDQAETLTNRACRDIVAELAVRLPSGSSLAIGSQQELPLPVARLRAQGGMVEIAARDLAMDADEARALLGGAEVELSDVDVNELVERTEGWPAGLYLAALAMNAGSPRSSAGTVAAGDDRFIADYLRSEFLDRVSGPTWRSSPAARSSTGSAVPSATPPGRPGVRPRCSIVWSAATCW